MNDPWTLSAYRQMLLFQNNIGQPSLVFENPSHAQQDVLQSLAHRPDLGLEYEYNLANRQAFICHPIPLQDNDQPESLLDQYLQTPIILESLDLAIHHSTDPMPLFGQPEPRSFNEDMFSFEVSPDSTFRFEDNPLFPKAVGTGSSVLEDFIHGHPSNATLTQDQSNSMEIVLLRDTPQNLYAPMPKFGVPTRGGSISSQGRGRVGKMLSRVSSSRSTAGSMFSCFDSKSIQSGMTDTSTSSRRSRRAMDKFAIAAMHAVKVIGACWRCKLLRKQVSTVTYSSLLRHAKFTFTSEEEDCWHNFLSALSFGALLDLTGPHFQTYLHCSGFIIPGHPDLITHSAMMATDAKTAPRVRSSLIGSYLVANGACWRTILFLYCFAQGCPVIFRKASKQEQETAMQQYESTSIYTFGKNIEPMI